MAEIRTQTRVGTGSGTQVQIDQGLRSYMLGVYNYMALGVAFTAVVILAVASSPAALATVMSLKWVLFFAVLGLGFFAPKLIFSNNAATAHAAYWGYAGLWGLMMAPMVAHFLGANPGMVAKAFFSTAIAFGATSLIGYTSKRDLSGFGAFFAIASIGLLVAMIVNIFMASSLFSLLISGAVVLLFAAITAYETQQIKAMYVEGDLAGVARSKSIFGAFMLYGSFVTMFVHILNIFGIMGSNE
jgi:uncharacterized protein